MCMCGALCDLLPALVLALPCLTEGAPCPVPALCVHATQKVGFFGPLPPAGQDNRNGYCVPIHRTAQILTPSKNSDRAMFHTENAGLLSKSAVFALQTYASLVVGGLRFAGWSRETLLTNGRCACAAQKRPLSLASSLHGNPTELNLNCHLS